MSSEATQSVIAPVASPEVITFLQNRRSVLTKTLDTDPLERESIETILNCGLRVPDHGALAPWKVVVIEKAAGSWFGTEVLAPTFMANHSDATEAMLDAERTRFTRGGVVFAVISTPVESLKIKDFEMQLSAGAVCLNLVSAGLALGYGAQWLTEWPAFDDTVLDALGGRVGTDKIAGFVYVGKKTIEPKPRRRPDPATTVHWLEPDTDAEIDQEAY